MNDKVTVQLVVQLTTEELEEFFKFLVAKRHGITVTATQAAPTQVRVLSVHEERKILDEQAAQNEPVELTAKWRVQKDEKGREYGIWYCATSKFAGTPTLLRIIFPHTGKGVLLPPSVYRNQEAVAVTADLKTKQPKTRKYTPYLIDV